jgi:hypothetical protein
MQELFIQFINYVRYLLHDSALHCHPQGAFLVPSSRCSTEDSRQNIVDGRVVSLSDAYLYIDVHNPFCSKWQHKQTNKQTLSFVCTIYQQMEYSDNLLIHSTAPASFDVCTSSSWSLLLSVLLSYVKDAYSFVLYVKDSLLVYCSYTSSTTPFSSYPSSTTPFSSYPSSTTPFSSYPSSTTPSMYILPSGLRTNINPVAPNDFKTSRSEPFKN